LLNAGEVPWGIRSGLSTAGERNRAAGQSDEVAALHDSINLVAKFLIEGALFGLKLAVLRAAAVAGLSGVSAPL
jgi:hypothetical protein